jgi:hypothetical protein
MMLKDIEHQMGQVQEDDFEKTIELIGKHMKLKEVESNLSELLDRAIS